MTLKQMDDSNNDGQAGQRVVERAGRRDEAIADTNCHPDGTPGPADLTELSSGAGICAARAAADCGAPN